MDSQLSQVINPVTGMGIQLIDINKGDLICQDQVLSLKTPVPWLWD